MTSPRLADLHAERARLGRTKRRSGAGSVRTLGPGRYQALGPRMADGKRRSLGVHSTPEKADAVREAEIRRLTIEAELPPPIVPWPILGGVYFVGLGDRVKIGVTKSIAKRLAGLQTGAPGPLRLFAVAPGGPAEERAYHARFAPHRRTGEWFDLAPEIRATIAALRKAGL